MKQFERYLILLGFLLGLAANCLAPLAAAQEQMELMIISPSNGEIFYASKLGYIVAIPITGRVTAADGAPEAIEVQLTINSFHADPVQLSTLPR